MGFPYSKREIILLTALIVCAFGIRILFFSVAGYRVDMNTFTAWFNTAAEHGIREFYNIVWCDYPPFNIYLFWVFGTLAKFAPPAQITYLIKLVPNLFDVATFALIFTSTRKQFNFKTTILTTAIYAFNPAVIFNTAVWGQFDAVYTFFLTLSLLLLLDSKPKFSAVTFTLAVLTKPQSIALAPLIIFLIFKKHDLRHIFTVILTVATTTIIIIAPFEWSNPISFLTKIYFGAYEGYAFTTVNAFNIWAFGGMWVPEAPIHFILGWSMFGAIVAFMLYLLNEKLDPENRLHILFVGFMLLFSFFMFPTRIHERYLFPALSLLALLFPFYKKIRPIYGVLTATCLLNQAYVLAFLNSGSYIPVGDPVALAGTSINLIVFLYALIFLPANLKTNIGTKQITRLDTAKQDG